MGLGQFDEAKECYESLRELGETSSAENCLKKLAEAQEKVRYLYLLDQLSCKNNAISNFTIRICQNKSPSLTNSLYYKLYII